MIFLLNSVYLILTVLYVCLFMLAFTPRSWEPSLPVESLADKAKAKLAPIAARFVAFVKRLRTRRS